MNRELFFGVLTAAAIIGAGGHGLINGASIWTPAGLAVTYDPTKPHNYGINLENFIIDTSGAKPHECCTIY